MKILAIIVTYNGMRWVDRCLGSVYASQTPMDAFVADNGSSDGTAGYVEEHFPEAVLVRNASNLGFAEGNNQGFRYALEHGYDYVYLLNQDAWIDPETAGELVRVHEARPEFGILSPYQYQADGRTYNPVFEKEVMASRREVPGMPGLSSVPFVMAAHWFMPADTLRRVGLFAELFPIYGNDDDYCHRVLYRGLKLGVVGTVRGIHDKQYGPVSVEQKVYRNYYMGSLVALADPRRPWCLSALYVIALTFVKTLRYRSLVPFRYLVRIFGSDDMRAVRKLRREALV